MAGQGWIKGPFKLQKPKEVNNWCEKGRIATKHAYNDNSTQYFMFSGELHLLDVGNISILNKCLNATKLLDFNSTNLSKQTCLAF